MARDIYSNTGANPAVRIQVLNNSGSPVGGAAVTVRTGGSAASLFSDEALSASLGNPITADGSGVATYYAAGGNTYTHTVTGATGLQAIEDVRIHAGSSSSGSTVDTAALTALITADKAATIAVVIESGGVYAARPTGYGQVRWVGVDDPASGALDGDEWVNTA